MKNDSKKMNNHTGLQIPSGGGSVYLVYAKLSEDKKRLKYFTLSDCGGYTKKIRPNLLEWGHSQWMNFKHDFPINWNFLNQYGANYDLEQLGKPKHTFNNKLIG